MGTEYLSLNWRDINRRYLMRQGVAESEEGYKLLAAEQGAAHRLLAAAANSMLDPQVLLRAVRDTDGQVIDFRYLTVNAAACSYLGLHEDDLVGHTPARGIAKSEGLQAAPAIHPVLGDRGAGGHRRLLVLQ